MNAELLEKAFAAASAHSSDQAGDLSAIKAVLHVAIEACAEIASRDSVLDWAGGSTGNAVGTREKINRQIRALLD